VVLRVSHVDRVHALKAGINLELNYLGRVDDFAVYHANCPADLNCALHITGISPGASNEEIVEQIHEGGILSLHKKNPIHGSFSTCAVSFSSILGQSRAAMKCFHEYLKFMEWEPYFKIWYATDPCEPNLV
jgi:hypothetical protein